jgi:2-C-methyl-D-erythritol 4-phosphate cytidylyltransferase
MRVAALVLGAGRGERLGYALPKAFVPVAGRPLIAHAVAALAAVPEIDLLVPVVPEAERARFDGLASDLGLGARLAAAQAGGAERQDSVRAGLDALPPDVEVVAVHDAARPLVGPEMVREVIAGATRCGAAILAAPVADTIKRVRDGRVVETPPREECWAAQTPQAFRVELLREALEKAAAEGRLGTDCSQLVEALGVTVHVVAGDPGNLKVTGPEDLARVARALEGRS